MEEMLSHVMERFGSALVCTTPFPHFYLDEVFPEDVYRDMIDSLPPLSYYTSAPPYPERYKFELTAQNLQTLPFAHCLFWSRFAEALYDKRFLFAALERFQEPLRRRLGQGFCEKVHASAILTSDRDHYSISPHTDVPAKVITLLFYLPRGREQIDLGTALYCPMDPHFTCEGHNHYALDAFVKVGKAPFLPNSVFGFLKTNNSFHGVEPIGKQEKGRNLLTYTVWASNRQ